MFEHPRRLTDPSGPTAELVRLLVAARDRHSVIEGLAGGAAVAVQLSRGRIRCIRLPEPQPCPLGELVWRHQILPRSSVEAAAAWADRNGHLLGRALARRGLEPDKLRDLLRLQVLERFRRFMDSRPHAVRTAPAHPVPARSLSASPVTLEQALVYWAERLPRWQLAVWARRQRVVRPSNRLARWLPAEAALGPMAETAEIELSRHLLAGDWAVLGRLWLVHVLSAGPRPSSEASGTRSPVASRAQEIPRDPRALRRWWRRIVWEHHPDRGGDERLFLYYKALYERLRSEVRS